MANSTVTDALTKIFLALGGDTQKLQDDHNLTDYLDDLGDALVDAVKAELPAVTSTDNGKVLKVTDGAWAKGEISSNSPLIITVTGNNISEAQFNHTFSEAITAFNNGVPIYLSFPDTIEFGDDGYFEYEGCIAPLIVGNNRDYMFFIAFSTPNPEDDPYNFIGFFWTEAGLSLSWSKSMYP